jgi:hypothetical protein
MSVREFIQQMGAWLNNKRVFIILMTVNTLAFFTLWLLELNFGFRPTERIGWFFYGNDAHSYLDPVENLISKGTYAMKSGPTAFRMPGFLPFYGPLYLLFGQAVGLHLFALLNLGFQIGTSFFVFKLSQKFTTTALAFFVAAAFSMYPRLMSYGYMGMSETIAAFSMIACIYCFIRWLETSARKYAIWISVFSTILVMLKPIAILFLALLGVWVLWISIRTRKGFKDTLLVLVFFFAIPTLSLSTWTIRNYYAFEQFIPLTPTLSSKGADQAFRSFCRRTGQQFQSWQGKDARVWFVSPDNYMYDEEHAKSDPFPSYLYTSQFNIDSLRNLRTDWHQMLSGTMSTEDSIKMDREIEAKFWKYAQSFIDEHPFHFYVTIRFTFLKDFIFIKDSFAPFKQNNLIFKSLRAYYFLTYYALVVSLILGCIGLIMKPSRAARIIIGASLIFILFHVGMGRIENRYVLPAVPLFAVGLAIFINAVQRFLKTDKTS